MNCVVSPSASIRFSLAAQVWISGVSSSGLRAIAQRFFLAFDEKPGLMEVGKSWVLPGSTL
jgi:hypothetical protein